MTNLSDQERLFAAIGRDDLDAVKLLSAEDRQVANGGAVDLNRRGDEWGDTPLGAAITFGFTDIAKYLCQLPSIDVNAVDKNGASPLCIAAREGQPAIARVLCGIKGVDVNKRDGRGETPFMIAAYLNHLETLKILAAASGIELNAVDNAGATALSMAVKNGNAVVVDYLCRQEGIDVNLPSVTGSSPLLVATWFGRVRTLNCLIGFKRVDINFRNFSYFGETALHYAVRNGKVQTTEVLLQRKDIDLMIKNNKGQTPLDIAVKSKDRFQIGLMLACKMPKLDVNKQYQEGLTLLHMAVITENEEAKSYLCSIPGAKNIKNKSGKTPFDLAAESDTCPLSFLLCLHSLIGTSLIDINHKFRLGKTLLHIAVENNNIHATERLLKHDGVDINASDISGNTAIHYASLNRNSNLYELLTTQEGANVMIENNDGLTPLYILSKDEENYPLILQLASKIVHMDPDIQFYNGNTLLHMAVLCQDKVALRYLTTLKTKIIENDEGYTPFDLAAINKNKEMIMLFYKQKEVDFWHRSNAHSNGLEVLSSDAKNYPFLLALARKTSKLTVNAKLAGGNTLLHMAVLSKNEKELRHLCRLPGAKNIKNDQNKTPFDLAAEFGPLKMLLYLYQLPGPGLRYINQAFRDRKTLLHLAVEEKNWTTLKKLCSIPGIMNRRDSQDRTPFDIALQQKDFPQAILLLLYNCRGVYLNSINALLLEGKTLLHIAVEENNNEFIESLLDRNSDVDVNIRDREGLSVVHYAVLFERHDSLRLLCSRTNIDLNKKYNGKMPLEMAIEKRSFEIAIFLLAQENIDINDVRTGDANEKASIFNILRSVVEEKRHSRKINKSEDINLLETLSEKYLTNHIASLEFIPALRKLMVHDDPPLLNYLGKLKESIHLTDSQKNLCKALYNTIVKGLQQYVYDKRLTYVFLEQHVLEVSIQNLIFHKNLNSTSGDEFVIKMLKIVFFCLQLNNECTVNTKDFLKQSLKHNNYIMFKELITQLALKKTPERNMVLGDCSDSQLIANSILAIYFNEGTSLQSLLRFKINRTDRKLSHLFGMTKILHDCTARRTFSIIPCFWFIGVHISDFISDAIVGYQTWQGFSPKLGIFMIGLVIVSLIQENLRSHESLYRYEKNHLRHILRRAEVTPQDWLTHSNLHTYHSFRWGFKQSLQFLWPFQVKGDKSKRYFRSLSFNMLSIIMLRPAIDRLLVLTHFPTNIREIFLHKANQISHRQYHMILEQIPELLIQFYLLQINWNNINDNRAKIELSCLASSTKNFDFPTEHFGCSENLFGISDSCISTIQLYSVIVTFFRIPAFMVGIERSFRKLDPATPPMSLVAHYSLYLIYMMMVPARIFFFAALIHSTQNPLLIVCYIAIVVLILFSRNCLSMNQENVSLRNLTGELTKFKVDQVVSLMLFSFRDVFFISLREPIAYITTPAEVTYSSLRTSKVMTIFSMLFFIEGVVGAIIIEQYYPCGMKSNFFKYQGWMYLVLLVYSTMVLTLLAYTLQPKKINILRNRFHRQAFKIGAFGSFCWMAATTTFWITREKRTDLEEILVIAATVFMFSLFIGNTLLLKHYGEASINVNKKPVWKKEEVSEATNTPSHGARRKTLSLLRHSAPTEADIEEV
ncbi:hypothetical protein ACHWQZ_G005977 [Mnemiopsis leidyi]